MSEDFERALEGVSDDRRAFLRKMVVGTAFAVPVVSSFSMAGVQAAFAQTPAVSARPAPSETTGTAPGGSTPTSSSTTTTTISNQDEPNRTG
jgi:hypothetical protein